MKKLTMLENEEKERLLLMTLLFHAYIIPTNEELMIAKDTYSLVLQG